MLADVAQSVERVLGKDEVTGSIPVIGSIRLRARATDRGRYGGMSRRSGGRTAAGRTVAKSDRIASYVSAGQVVRG